MPLLQLICVRQGLLLPRQQHLRSCGRLGLPESDVGVLTAGDDHSTVHRVQDTIDLLHPLRVVDLAGAAVIHSEYTDGLIKAAGYEFAARR